jgi:diguanylate cyclase (GGDEF)-like protein/PAS domain S-box-containing protein
MYSYSLLLLLATLITLSLAAVAWHRRAVAGARAFACLMGAVSVWSLAYALELSVTNLNAVTFWARVQYFGIVLVPIAWITFALQYANRDQWITRRKLSVLAIEPLIVLLLVWTNEWHKLIWIEIDIASRGTTIGSGYTYGPGFWANAAYTYLLILAGTLILIQTLIRSPDLYRGQVISLLVGVMAPWAGNAVYLAGLSPLPNLDLTPFALTISGIAVAWSLFRYRFLDLLPVAHDAIITNMSDGVIVLDLKNRIVDINSAAEKMISPCAAQVVGQPAEDVFYMWHNLINEIRVATTTRADVVIGDTHAQSCYDLRLSPVEDRRGRLTGRLIVLREITDRKKLEEALHQRANELATLHAISLEITAPHELSALLKTIVRRAVVMLDATGGDIGLYEEERGELRIIVSHNMGKDYAGTRMAPGEGAMGLALQRNELVVIEDYEQWDGRSPQYTDGPWHAGMAIPLRFRDRMVGALGVVDSNLQRRFSEDDQRLLNLFAQQAAIAVENARLYEAEKHRAAELAVLFEGSSAITRSIDHPAVVNTTAEQLAAAVKATSVYILACDLEGGRATVLGEHISPQANSHERISDVGDSFDLNDFPRTLQALRSGEPLSICISDASIDPQDRNELEENNIKAALNVPMISSGRVIGYAEIWDSHAERDWDEEEIRVCQTLANQAAVALDNARLYSEMKRMAITDALTGMYNRRGFFEMGQREISRARRYSHPLSAIMLDIDHFKQINDAYSHAAGDQVLGTLGRICHSQLREVDILGRFGGEEFAILLPETDGQSAYHAAERLRQCVASTPVVTDRGIISITISVGIACAKDELSDLAVLLDQADTAMYVAKEAGRNRVETISGVRSRAVEGAASHNDPQLTGSTARL